LVFIQVAGRTVLAREDLPTEDWVVIPGRDRGHRLATAWRKPWFDHRLDATRKLAFLGGSTEGSFFLALRYLVRRFGLAVAESDLAATSANFAQRATYPHVLDVAPDLALSAAKLVLLDVPGYWGAEDLTPLLTA
jgi:hypothetical protein